MDVLTQVEWQQLCRAARGRRLTDWQGGQWEQAGLWILAVEERRPAQAEQHAQPTGTLRRLL